MMADEVMQQIWAAKEAFARQFNYEVRAMGRYLESLDQPGVQRVVEAPVAPQALNTPSELPESVFEAAPALEDI